jgi:hypothetical protein
MISVPPVSEVASPSDDTVTSMRAPERTKGGRLAVTMTAATFLARERPPSLAMPRFSSMARIDCSVNGELRRLSPEPWSPITRP